MRRVTRDDIAKAVGRVDDVTIAQIIGTGATVDELAEAQAWIVNDEPLMKAGKPLASGRACFRICGLPYRPRGLKPAMTRDDMAFGISENWIGKAERFDRCADLIDLALGMGACIARIGNEIAQQPVGDGQPRRFCRRYFVHTGTSPK